MKKLLTATFVATMLGLTAAQVFAQDADTDYVLNTASTGGTYHPVGTAIANLVQGEAVTDGEIQSHRCKFCRFGCQRTGIGC